MNNNPQAVDSVQAFAKWQKPFACGFCKMSFSVPMDLNMHINFDHSSSPQINTSGKIHNNATSYNVLA